MTTFTTCRTCSNILETTDGQKVHADCEMRLTEIEILSALWLIAAEEDNHDDMAKYKAEMDEYDDRPPRLGDAAEIYAHWGWPVFPLRAGSKIPATMDGFKSATTDIDKIRNWWALQPNYNIGVATGEVFDVIDVDTPIDFESLAKLEDLGFLDEIHAHVATASGGVHYYIKTHGRGNTVNMAAKVDYRGIGGYVVAPPSVTYTADDDGHMRRRGWSYVTPPSPILKR